MNYLLIPVAHASQLSTLINTTYNTTTAATTGYLTNNWIPVMLFLLGVTVLFFVARKILSVFGGRRHRVH